MILGVTVGTGLTTGQAARLRWSRSARRGARAAESGSLLMS